MTTSGPSSNTSTTASQLKSEAQDAAETAKDEARQLKDKVAREGAAYARDVKHQAVSYAESKKDSVADEGHNVASALRKAADEMRAGSPQERTLGQIADGIADASDAIKDRDLGQMVGDLNGFARRNPAVFLGAAALLGFAAVRFAKASSDGASRDAGLPAQRSAASAPMASPDVMASHHRHDMGGRS